MKIKDVLVMAAIGLLGAACSDDDNKGSQWGDGVGGTKTNLDVSAYDKWTCLLYTSPSPRDCS